MLVKNVIIDYNGAKYDDTDAHKAAFAGLGSL